MSRISQGAAALGVAGVAFVAYPATRPYDSGGTASDGPSVWADPWWVPSHLLGVLAFALLVPGLAALWAHLRGTAGESSAWAALLSGGSGAALVLPYYGAESFALAELGRPGAGVAPDVALVLGEAIREEPFALATFAAGLAALAAAGIAAAVAIRRGGGLPTWVGVLFAAGLVLYLPQFFAPSILRIGHGALLAAACVLLALAVNRSVGAAAASPTDRARA